MAYGSLAPPLPTEEADFFNDWVSRLGKSLWAGAKAPGDAVFGRLAVPVGLRREDFTDLPGPTREEAGQSIFTPLPAQPIDPAVERATDLAGLVMGGTAGTAPKGAIGSGPSIRAYHASPHDFNKFDLGKIGTGEGAQVYGHGLYFAESPNVMEEYFKQFARGKDQRNVQTPTIGGKPYDDHNPLHVAANFMSGSGGKEGALKEVRLQLMTADRSQKPFLRQVQDALESGDVPKTDPLAHRYEVNIRAQPERFLDWEKPISQQAKPVVEAVSEVAKQIRPGWFPTFKNELKEIRRDIASSPTSLGGEVYGALSRGVDVPGGNMVQSLFKTDSKWGKSPSEASAMLRDAGIPGIKYLDEGSRRPAVSTGYRNVDIELGQFGGDWQAFKTAKLGRSKQLDAAIADIDAKGGPQMAAKPTRNYVVFDDSLIDILRKYGLAGVPAMGAVYGSMAPSGDR